MWNYFRRIWRHRDTLIDTKDLSRGSDEEKSQRACFIKKYNNLKRAI